MMAIRRSEERGPTRIGWLDSRHSFSFGQYHDPRFMGFRALRVINEDRVTGGAGFGEHPHRDMEIISYVLSGALEHRDSMGNGAVIRPGDVQIMSAGTGVRHSEFNHAAADPVHFLQIWILPDRAGHTPSYQQQAFTEDDKRGRLRLVGSPDGRGRSVLIHQDVDLYAAILPEGVTVTHSPAQGRHVWVQVARGTVEVNGQLLNAGDGAALSDEDTVALTGKSNATDTEVLVFDLA